MEAALENLRLEADKIFDEFDIDYDYEDELTWKELAWEVFIEWPRIILHWIAILAIILSFSYYFLTLCFSYKPFGIVAGVALVVLAIRAYCRARNEDARKVKTSPRIAKKNRKKRNSPP